MLSALHFTIGPGMVPRGSCCHCVFTDTWSQGTESPGAELLIMAWPPVCHHTPEWPLLRPEESGTPRSSLRQEGKAAGGAGRVGKEGLLPGGCWKVSQRTPLFPRGTVWGPVVKCKALSMVPAGGRGSESQGVRLPKMYHFPDSFPQGCASWGPPVEVP